jgi:hypothetical protein
MKILLTLLILVGAQVFAFEKNVSPINFSETPNLSTEVRSVIQYYLDTTCHETLLDASGLKAKNASITQIATNQTTPDKVYSLDVEIYGWGDHDGDTASIQMKELSNPAPGSNKYEWINVTSIRGTCNLNK